jgi:hypothetical protein
LFCPFSGGPRRPEQADRRKEREGEKNFSAFLGLREPFGESDVSDLFLNLNDSTSEMDY